MRQLDRLYSRLMRYGSSFFRDTNKKSVLINQISQERNIKDPENVAEQILRKDPILKFRYKDDEIFINNESSALYHILNSTSKIEALVNSIELDECKTVFDIGANIGLFAFFIKKKYPQCYIFLFEPDERLHHVINLNLKEFNRFEILKYAVCDISDQEIDFYINSNSAQTNSLDKSAITIVDDEKYIETTKVNTITLDSFCLDRNIESIDVLKIDIQGAEMNAFKGGDKALKMTKILLAEASFIGGDLLEYLTYLKDYFPFYKPINSVFMGADLKFYRD